MGKEGSSTEELLKEVVDKGRRASGLSELPDISVQGTPTPSGSFTKALIGDDELSKKQ